MDFFFVRLREQFAWRIVHVAADAEQFPHIHADAAGIFRWGQPANRAGIAAGGDVIHAG